MIRLGVNVDHVATLRQARREKEPDPVEAAMLCELAGAYQITLHVRGDRRHVQERDLRLLRQLVKTRINLEMAATPEMVAIATEIKPDQSTLVPEKREELTTEGGLDVAGQVKSLPGVIKALQGAGIMVSLFIDPEPEQIRASREVGAQAVELHTGPYANAKTAQEEDREFERLYKGAQLAHDVGLAVIAGHGLTYRNVQRITTLPHLEEVNIGHNIVARAVMVGMERAVREMIALLNR